MLTDKDKVDKVIVALHSINLVNLMKLIHTIPKGPIVMDNQSTNSAICAEKTQ